MSKLGEAWAGAADAAWAAVKEAEAWAAAADAAWAAATQAEAKDDAEYELIGTIDGTYGGRWMLAAFAEKAGAVWPDGTAVYVRRIKE